MRLAFITGLASDSLRSDEAAFLRASRPAGIILFARNCVAPEQIRALVGDALNAIGSADALVLIDQEGGRVRRLQPPIWRDLPAASAYAGLYATDPQAAVAAARLAARLTAEDLSALAINTNCAPVLDVPAEGAHQIIGDRAYGRNWQQVAALGRAVAQGYMDGAVLPVIKHIPGHGRANADSHLELPNVATPSAELEASDFAPFRLLRDLPAAMTAHVVYSAIDATSPASTSVLVTREIIRGKIGFEGFLMSDDLCMKALNGPMRDRAQAVIQAGSDAALHCSGNLAEMQAVAAGVPALQGAGLRRFDRCLDVLKVTCPFDRAEAERVLAGVLELPTHSA